MHNGGPMTATIATRNGFFDRARELAETRRN
jgi:hypothetical protein